MQNTQKCGNINGKKLTPEVIDTINAVLAKDQRVELIPTLDGVKVIHIRREEVKYCSPL